MQDQGLNGVTAIIAEAHANKNGALIECGDGSMLVLLSEGFRAEPVRALNPKLPDFIADRRVLIDQGSFTAFVSRFATPKNSIILANPEAAAMTAHFDFHDPSGHGEAKPGRNVHQAVFDCGFDEDWKRWRAVNGKLMVQEEFAYFIEEMLHTVAKPDGADLLEMAQTLKINRGVVFKSNTRLRDGTVDIAYEEKDEANTKAGKVSVPEELTVVSPIYPGRAPIATKIKLRYRVEKGEPLRFRFDVLNIKTIELKEFQTMAGEISVAANIPVFFSKN